MPKAEQDVLQAFPHPTHLQTSLLNTENLSQAYL